MLLNPFISKAEALNCLPAVQMGNPGSGSSTGTAFHLGFEREKNDSSLSFIFSIIFPSIHLSFTYQSIFFFFSFLAAPAACGNSPRWNWIWVAAAIYATPGATLDPLTHCARPRIKPRSLQDPKCCNQNLNPLRHRGNSRRCYFFSLLNFLYYRWFILFYFFFVFLPFLGPLPQHMEIPRLGVESEL